MDFCEQVLDIIGKVLIARSCEQLMPTSFIPTMFTALLFGPRVVMSLRSVGLTALLARWRAKATGWTKEERRRSRPEEVEME